MSKEVNNRYCRLHDRISRTFGTIKGRLQQEQTFKADNEKSVIFTYNHVNLT